MAPLLPLTALLLTASPTAEPGQVYAGGTRVKIPELWVSFVVPKGMRGGLTEQAFVMGSETEAAMLIGIGDRGLSVAQISAVFSRPLPLDGATTLQPTGAPTVKGNTVTNGYTLRTDKGEFVGFSEARRLDNGAAVGFISLASTKKAAKRRLRRVMRSVRVEAPPKAPRAGAASGAWAKRLPGRTLVYMKTGNGMTTEKKIQLCRNGRFQYSGNEGYLSGGFSAAGQGGGGGAWSLRGDTLTLTWGDGTVDRRTLRADGGKTFLNGTRWFVTEGACGGR